MSKLEAVLILSGRLFQSCGAQLAKLFDKSVIYENVIFMAGLYVIFWPNSLDVFSNSARDSESQSSKGRSFHILGAE